MKVFLKSIRVILIIILSIIVLLTIYFIIDRYVLNTNMKGISPVDIKNVLGMLILPLALLIIVIRQIEKRIIK